MGYDRYKYLLIARSSHTRTSHIPTTINHKRWRGTHTATSSRGTGWAQWASRRARAIPAAKVLPLLSAKWTAGGERSCWKSRRKFECACTKRPRDRRGQQQRRRRLCRLSLGQQHQYGADNITGFCYLSVLLLLPVHISNRVCSDAGPGPLLSSGA